MWNPWGGPSPGPGPAGFGFSPVQTRGTVGSGCSSPYPPPTPSVPCTASCPRTLPPAPRRRRCFPLPSRGGRAGSPGTAPVAVGGSRWAAVLGLLAVGAGVVLSHAVCVCACAHTRIHARTHTRTCTSACVGGAGCSLSVSGDLPRRRAHLRILRSRSDRRAAGPRSGARKPRHWAAPPGVTISGLPAGWRELARWQRRSAADVRRFFIWKCEIMG